LKVGQPSEAAIPGVFGSDIPDKDQVWKSVVSKYRLRNISLDDIATWEFADFILKREWPVTLDLLRAHELG